jgi:predicted HD phosphohydrolase
MSSREVAAFESERYFREAVRVRQWDDAGKVAGLKTASLSAYAAMIDALTSEAL